MIPRTKVQKNKKYTRHYGKIFILLHTNCF